jgi:hypothetical protein
MLYEAAQEAHHGNARVVNGDAIVFIPRKPVASIEQARAILRIKPKATIERESVQL